MGREAKDTNDGEPGEEQLDGLVEDEDVKHELPDEGVVAPVQVVCEALELQLSSLGFEAFPTHRSEP